MSEEAGGGESGQPLNIHSLGPRRGVGCYRPPSFLPLFIPSFQPDFQLAILLPQPLKCWDHRCVSLCPACLLLSIRRRQVRSWIVVSLVPMAMFCLNSGSNSKSFSPISLLAGSPDTSTRQNGEIKSSHYIYKTKQKISDRHKHRYPRMICPVF